MPVGFLGFPCYIMVLVDAGWLFGLPPLHHVEVWMAGVVVVMTFDLLAHLLGAFC